LGQERHPDDLAHQLQRLVLRLGRELRSHNAGAGASNTEVRHSPGLGVSELAAVENVSRSVMSERVKRLEQAGLVTSGPGADRRRIALTITETGRDLLERITARRRAWMAERLTALSPEERLAVQVAVTSLERITGQAGPKMQNSKLGG